MEQSTEYVHDNNIEMLDEEDDRHSWCSSKSVGMNVIDIIDANAFGLGLFPGAQHSDSDSLQP